MSWYGKEEFYDHLKDNLDEMYEHLIKAQQIAKYVDHLDSIDQIGTEGIHGMVMKFLLTIPDLNKDSTFEL